MRRASAISALSAICYSFFAPMLFADAEANLPACCRRNGAHHCGMQGAMQDAMTSMDTEEAPSPGGPGFQSIRQVCPAFPGITARAADGAVALLETAPAIFAGLVSHPSIQRQTEARYRVAFSRSRQKRGPPAFFS